MNALQIVQQILGETQPWHVAGIELDKIKQTLTIEMSLDQHTVWGCPQCHRRMTLHGYDVRSWRHLDTQGYKTQVSAQVPLVRCSEHGTQQIGIPWAEPYSRKTKAFEQLSIVLLKGMATSNAGEVLGLSWDEADGVKQRAVERGLERRELPIMRHLCVDEKRLSRKIWVTIVCCTDGDKAVVVYVGIGRNQKALDRFWKSLNKEHLEGIESVTMDMCEAFANSVKAYVPGGSDKIVYDRYHVSQHMSKAIDEVRRQEQASLDKEGQQAMKGSRFYWLYNPDHRPRRLVRQYKELEKIARKTAKAYEFKELLRAFWECPDEASAHAHLAAWLKRALRSSLQPVRRVANLCKSHLKNLLTYFAHRVTNASAESINARIQGLINKACGYRNAQRAINDILFHFGNLDLMPR